jgi:hypothetical protein
MNSLQDIVKHVPARKRRRGIVLVLLVVALPALIGIVGLVLDVSLMSALQQDLQHATDAASTAAAMDLMLGADEAHARLTADEYIHVRNQMPTASVVVNIPPATGPYAGDSGFVETIATQIYTTRFMHVLGGAREREVKTRSVAGRRAATAGAAIVVLDPAPQPLSISGIPPLLPALPTLLGGLEVLGLGRVRVDGAVLVNTTWGGVDENGNVAGNSQGPPYAVSCTPLIQLTRLEARDIRVAGGVDDPNNYRSFAAGAASPLRANRLPSPDPLIDLPVPTESADPANVSSVLRGTQSVAGLPLLSPPVVLQPGVYDWIQVLSGSAVFQPGVYVIRGKNPATQLALNIAGGTVTAEGVMFYITNSAGYSPATGGPDSADATDPSPPPTVPTLLPSVVINAALANSSFSPISSAQSPYHGILLFQRRQDSRPIVLLHQNLLLGGSISGTIYSKWGHALFVGSGNYDLRFVAGTVRILSLLDMTIAPSTLLPPAHDVFLVE